MKCQYEGMRLTQWYPVRVFVEYGNMENFDNRDEKKMGESGVMERS